MKEKLLQYMAKYTNLNEADQQFILESLNIQGFTKGTQLAGQGDSLDPTKCYFVLSGCVRQYQFNVDGKEITTNFYTEEQAILLSNFTREDLSSKYSLTCTEDCVLVVGDMESEQEMYQQYSELEKMTRRMMETYLGQTQNEFANFISSTPEERYKSIIENRPDLLTRVPQHQLASYLGITPESLSRIKKRTQHTPTNLSPS
ncbi:Crp/Fnr family transcriptional regulator [Ornithinibacillus californiensis]|uniref:Crp/Fnr family transcriptional regulator n=1 Tax=Ornithinibacillus californiensis TaxID=161536 RepID=UPI00064D88B8|nr:Crp/Fnr family transcriptional regulator [Ornithinibacillus californiensis]